MGCFTGICHFRFMLEGRRFAISMDYKPLTLVLKQSSVPAASEKRPLQAELSLPANVKAPLGLLTAATAARVSPVAASLVSDVVSDYEAIAVYQQTCPATAQLAANTFYQFCQMAEIPVKKLKRGPGEKVSQKNLRPNF